MRLRVACHCSQKLPPTKKDQRKKNICPSIHEPRVKRPQTYGFGIEVKSIQRIVDTHGTCKMKILIEYPCGTIGLRSTRPGVRCAFS